MTSFQAATEPHTNRARSLLTVFGPVTATGVAPLRPAASWRS